MSNGAGGSVDFRRDLPHDERHIPESLVPRPHGFFAGVEEVENLCLVNQCPLSTYSAEHLALFAQCAQLGLHGITKGTQPGYFSPAWAIDRGQIITFLYRLARAADAWSSGVAPPAVVQF